MKLPGYPFPDSTQATPAHITAAINELAAINPTTLTDPDRLARVESIATWITDTARHLKETR